MLIDYLIYTFCLLLIHRMGTAVRVLLSTFFVDNFWIVLWVSAVSI